MKNQSVRTPLDIYCEQLFFFQQQDSKHFAKLLKLIKDIPVPTLTRKLEESIFFVNVLICGQISHPYYTCAFKFYHNLTTQLSSRELIDYKVYLEERINPTNKPIRNLCQESYKLNPSIIPAKKYLLSHEISQLL